MTFPNRPSGGPSAQGGAPIATLAMIRDLPLRLPIPPALEQEIQTFVKRPTPAAGETDAVTYYESALQLTQKCVDYLESETARLTESVFSVGDAAAVKQRIVGDPRKQLDTVLNAIKQKIASEKNEWGRRFAKQSIDVNDGLGKQLEALTVSSEIDVEHMFVVPEGHWKGTFSGWFDDVLTRWGQHVSGLLKKKTTDAVAEELAQVSTILDAKIAIRAREAGAVTVPALGDIHALQEKIEVPTRGEIFIETLKGGLNTVAMVAGLIVIPVVGQFTDQQPTHMRALFMSSVCVPIIAFSYLAMHKQRSKMISRNTEKAAQTLRKNVSEMSKARLERFKMEADRAVQLYLAAFQQSLLEQVDPYIESCFKKRDVILAGELTTLKLQTDRIQDQLAAVRQAKTGLATQLVVDLRRRLKELETV